MDGILVLGIDPGFACVGWARARLFPDKPEVIEAVGVLRTEKSNAKRQMLASDDNLRRARELAAELNALAQGGGVRAICAEAMSFPRNAANAAKVAMCWGVIADISQMGDVPVLQASPQEVKKAVCGKKDASKEEVQEALRVRFGANLSPLFAKIPASLREHPYDAVAAVVACLDAEALRLARKMAA